MSRTLIKPKNLFWYLMSLIFCVVGGSCARIFLHIQNPLLNQTFFSGMYFVSILLIACFLVLFIKGMDKQLLEER